MSKWESIQTAPKTGISILILCEWEPLAVVGKWLGARWVVAWDEAPFERGYEATHWMPILELQP